MLPPGRSQVCSVAFSPDGCTLASGAQDGRVALCDAQTGKLQRLLGGHGEEVNSLAFSPDGKLLASTTTERMSGEEGGIIRLWDPRTGALLRQLAGHTDAVTTLAFSPNGHTLASGSLDTTVRLWRIE